MASKYFVMLGTHHDGYVVPMLDSDGELWTSSSVQGAYVMGRMNVLGRMHGFKVFDSEADGE